MIVLTLLLFLPGLISGCQPECVCLNPDDVSCVASSLTQLPPWQDAINDATSLDLSLNDVTQLEPDAFHGLLKLETILLNYNQIEVVDELAFSELRHLRRLELENNVIGRLEENTFISNPRLHTLSLSGNPLNLTSNFLHSESLTTLDLSRCDLESLPSDLFAGLQQIHTLMLTHNSLESLPADFFDNLPSLQRVYLHGNPWRCDDVADLFLIKQDLIADYNKINCIKTEEVSPTTFKLLEIIKNDVEELLEGTEGPNVTEVKQVSRNKKKEEDLTVTIIFYMNVALICVILITAVVIVVLIRKNIIDCWLRRRDKTQRTDYDDVA